MHSYPMIWGGHRDKAGQWMTGYTDDRHLDEDPDCDRVPAAQGEVRAEADAMSECTSCGSSDTEVYLGGPGEPDVEHCHECGQDRRLPGAPR